MLNRRTFRIILVIACFVFALVNGYKILQNDYNMVDVFLMIAFLLFGGMYLYLLRKEEKNT